jgi:hypothetical protein
VQQKLGVTLNQGPNKNAIAKVINHCLNYGRIKQATTNFATKNKEQRTKNKEHNHQQL